MASFVFGAVLIVMGFVMVMVFLSGYSMMRLDRESRARKTKEKQADEQALLIEVRKLCEIWLRLFGFVIVSDLAQDLKTDELNVVLAIAQLSREEPQWIDIVRDVYCPHDKTLIATYSGEIPDAVICKQGQVHTHKDLMFRWKAVKPQQCMRVEA